MESFKQFKTNKEFGTMINQPFGWPMEKDPVINPNIQLDEAAKSFDELIDEVLKPNEKKVHGRYSIPSKSFQLTIDRRDQATFKKLFTAAPNKGVGNGEVSLYWLFNGGRNKAKETRGGNDPDLMINGKAVEVKAYPYHNPISLGRFQDRRAFRAMVNTLFGVANLSAAFEGGTGRGEQTFKGELAFKYKDLVESAEKFLSLKEVVENNSKALDKFKIFKDIMRTVGQFETQLKATGFKGRNPKANDIAAALIKNVVMESVADKPGDKGYVANLKEKDPLDIYFHYVDFANMATDEKILGSKGTISIGGGTLKINFSRVFG